MGRPEEDDFSSTRVQVKPHDKRHVDLTSYHDYEFIYPKLMSYGVVILLIIVYSQPLLMLDVPSGYIAPELDLRDLEEVESKVFSYYLFAIVISFATGVVYTINELKKYSQLAQILNIISAGFLVLLIREIVNIRSDFNSILEVLGESLNFGLAFYLLIIASLISVGAAYLDYNYSKVIEKQMIRIEEIRKCKKEQ